MALRRLEAMVLVLNCRRSIELVSPGVRSFGSWRLFVGDYFPDRRRWIHPADEDDGTSITSDIIAASAYSERFAYIQLSLSWPERRRWGLARCSTVSPHAQHLCRSRPLREHGSRHTPMAFQSLLGPAARIVMRSDLMQSSRGDGVIEPGLWVCASRSEPRQSRAGAVMIV